jgi:hypothetical protein
LWRPTKILEGIANGFVALLFLFDFLDVVEF